MARKRTKKATTRVGGNVITHDTYKFKSEYSDFKSEMEGVSGGDIGVKSKSLFSMIADHGVPVRDGSPNAGKAEKTSTLISKIEELFAKSLEKREEVKKNYEYYLTEPNIHRLRGERT